MTTAKARKAAAVPSNYTTRSSKKPKPRKAVPDVKPQPKPQTPGERMAGYEREQRHPSGTVWKRIKANVIAAHNGICHLCGHPGAEQVDHVEQYAEGGTDDISNLKPAHGSANSQKNPCPVCGLNCNNIRGALSVAAGKAKIARRIGKAKEPLDRDW